MKTKKSLLALAMVGMFAVATFAATSIETNNDDDKRVALEKKKRKIRPHG